MELKDIIHILEQARLDEDWESVDTAIDELNFLYEESNSSFGMFCDTDDEE